MVADKFVSLLLLARTVGHIEHLKTRSYAQHVALGAFYEGVGELADSFAEQYQGYYNRLLVLSVESAPRYSSPDDFIEKQCLWIEENRYKVCDKDDTALQNTIDEVVALYQSTLYKLRFLK